MIGRYDGLNIDWLRRFYHEKNYSFIDRLIPIGRYIDEIDWRLDSLGR